MAGRLITVRRAGISTTELAEELLDTVAATTRRSPRRLDGLRRILDCPHCGVPLETVRWRIYADDAQWDQAIAAYRKRMRGGR